ERQDPLEDLIAGRRQNVIASAPFAGALRRLHGEDPERMRGRGECRPELGVYDVHRVQIAGLEAPNRVIDEFRSLFRARPVADVGPAGGDLLAEEPEEGKTLLADHMEFRLRALR